MEHAEIVLLTLYYALLQFIKIKVKTYRLKEIIFCEKL